MRLRWALIGLGVVAVATGFALIPWHKTEETSTCHLCRTCGSRRYARRVLVDGYETHSSERLEPSAAFTDLFGADHEHDWAFYFRNQRVSSGLHHQISHGDGFPERPDRFVERYNDNGHFRLFVRERVRAGERVLERRDEVMRAYDSR